MYSQYFGVCLLRMLRVLAVFRGPVLLLRIVPDSSGISEFDTLAAVDTPCTIKNFRAPYCGYFKSWQYFVRWYCSVLQWNSTICAPFRRFPPNCLPENKHSQMVPRVVSTVGAKHFQDYSEERTGSKIRSIRVYTPSTPAISRCIALGRVLECCKVFRMPVLRVTACACTRGSVSHVLAVAITGDHS